MFCPVEDGKSGKVLLARCLPMAVDWDGNVGKDGNDLEILSDAPGHCEYSIVTIEFA